MPFKSKGPKEAKEQRIPSFPALASFSAANLSNAKAAALPQASLLPILKKPIRAPDLPPKLIAKAWTGEISYIPKDVFGQSQLQKFDSLHAKYLVSSQFPDTVLAPKKVNNSGNSNGSSLRSKKDGILEQNKEIARLEKGVRKDKESFRTNVVNIIMQSGSTGRGNDVPASRGADILKDDIVVDQRLVGGDTKVYDSLLGIEGGLEHHEDSSIGGTEDQKIQRYYYYISNGVDTQHVSPMEPSWLTNVLELIPEQLKRNQVYVESLSEEMREGYQMSIKKAIVDFVLKDPRVENLGSEEKESMLEFADDLKTVPTWKSDYIDNSILLESRLLITNPNVSEIFDVWSKFQSLRLIDMDSIIANGVPYDLKSFKALMTSRIEKSQEKLLTSWYPAMMNVLYQSGKKKGWTSISNDRVESFFKTVSLILADQVRHIIWHSALEFIAMFDLSTLRRTAGLENSHGVLFLVKMVLDENKIRLDPHVTEIQSTAETLLEAIFTAADSIPKLETQLFTLGQTSSARNGITPVKSELCLHIDFENTYPSFVADIRKKLKTNLNKLLEAPVSYLRDFDKHNSLISNNCQNDVTLFLSADKSQDSLMEEVKKYRNVATHQVLSGYPLLVNFSLVELQCAEFLQSLSERAIGLSVRITESLGIVNRASNAEIVKMFEELTKNITAVPSNVEEMVALKKFMDYSRVATLKKLDDSVSEAKKRLNFTLTFTDLKKEDYDMNSLLFSWPGKLAGIFQEGEEILIQSKLDNGNEMKVRKERLELEMESYVKQIEDFEGFGEYADINKYLKTAQRLQGKLDSIGDRISAFNHEEELLGGYEMTRFQTLATTIEALGPFITLYQTSVDLQKSYQAWIAGPKLPSESLEGEVGVLLTNMYKLSVVFEKHHTVLELVQNAKHQLEKYRDEIISSFK